MVAANKYHVAMPGNGYHPEYRNGFMHGVAATEAAVEKFTSTNSESVRCKCGKAAVVSFCQSCYDKEASYYYDCK